MATNYKTILNEINKAITDTHKMASKAYSLSPFVKDKDLIKLEMIKNALREARRICELPLEKVVEIPEAKEDNKKEIIDKEADSIRTELSELENKFRNQELTKEEARKVMEREDELKKELDIRMAKKKE